MSYRDDFKIMVYLAHEESTIIMKRVMLFIEEHGHSRFVELKKDKNGYIPIKDPVKNMAGFKRYSRKQHCYIYYFFAFFFEKQFGINHNYLEDKIKFFKPFLLGGKQSTYFTTDYIDVEMDQYEKIPIEYDEVACVVYRYGGNITGEDVIGMIDEQRLSIFLDSVDLDVKGITGMADE